MSIFDFLRESRKELLTISFEIYLFGSAVYSRTPNDIDILLVYDKQSLRSVLAGKKKIKELLSPKFDGLPIHFTTLSRKELKQTRFLNKIFYKKVT